MQKTVVKTGSCVEGLVGIEPTTQSLKGSRSTTELQALILVQRLNNSRLLLVTSRML